MRLLVSGATRTVPRLAKSHPGALGVLVTPDSGNKLDWVRDAALPWAADNAAFSGFNEHRFTTFVHAVERKAKFWDFPPLWVTAPDVVADHAATMDLFGRWEWFLHSCGLPVAFVAQDGATTDALPWDSLDAIFIGGSTEWKTSCSARAIVERAQALGKRTHMGRVNTRSRLEIAVSWGVETVDGSGFSRFPDERIPKYLGWVAA